MLIYMLQKTKLWSKIFINDMWSQNIYALKPRRVTIICIKISIKELSYYFYSNRYKTYFVFISYIKWLIR